MHPRAEVALIEIVKGLPENAYVEKLVKIQYITIQFFSTKKLVSCGHKFAVYSGIELELKGSPNRFLPFALLHVVL